MMITLESIPSLKFETALRISKKLCPIGCAIARPSQHRDGRFIVACGTSQSPCRIHADPQGTTNKMTVAGMDLIQLTVMSNCPLGLLDENIKKAL